MTEMFDSEEFYGGGYLETGVGTDRSYFHQVLQDRVETFNDNVDVDVYGDEMDISRLDEIEFFYDYDQPYRSGGKRSSAMIEFSPGFYRWDGDDYFSINKNYLFGLPKKMECLCFSLPAGPPGKTVVDGKKTPLYGSCPSSGYKVKDPMFICNGCYALQGGYIWPNYVIKSQLNLAFTKQAVDRGHYADIMEHAIKHTWSLPPSSLKIYKGGKTFDFTTHKYFRIHDSGDFFSKKYFEAWCDIASRMPGTLFWAPTRVTLTKDLQEKKSWTDLIYNEAPDNLIVRPSSLYFEDLPPFIDGIPLGSMVSTDLDVEDKFDGIKVCPAYDPRKHAPGRKDTCAGAGCRLCWTQPYGKAPMYPVHGDEAGRIYKMLEGRSVQHNPPVGYDGEEDLSIEKWGFPE